MQSFFFFFYLCKFILLVRARKKMALRHKSCESSAHVVKGEKARETTGVKRNRFLERVGERKKNKKSDNWNDLVSY